MPLFDFSMLISGPYHQMLVAGMWLSLQLMAVTLLLALPLAMGVALLRISSVAALRWLGASFVEGVRNVPLLAHMLLWYFGMPELLPDAGDLPALDNNPDVQGQPPTEFNQQLRIEEELGVTRG